jgi:hypothetical protein
MSALELKVYEIFKTRLSEPEDAGIIEYIEEKTEKKYEEKKDILATKEDISKLKEELRVEMREIKTDMIKWMFIFWIGQLAAMIVVIKMIK